LTPEQVADLDRRIAVLEKAAAGSPTPASPAGGNAGGRNADGCIMIPATQGAIRVTLSVGDRICTADGKPASRVTRIEDCELHLHSPARGRWECDLGNRCRLDLHSNVRLSIVKIHHGARATRTADVEFRVR
jgi:hypothetical protein